MLCAPSSPDEVTGEISDVFFVSVLWGPRLKLVELFSCDYRGE